MEGCIDSIIVFTQATIGKLFIINRIAAILCSHIAENLHPEALTIWWLQIEAHYISGPAHLQFEMLDTQDHLIKKMADFTDSYRRLPRHSMGIFAEGSFGVVLYII